MQRRLGFSMPKRETTGRVVTSILILWAVLALSSSAPASAGEGGEVLVRELSFAAPRVHPTADGEWVMVDLVGGEGGETVGAPDLPGVTLVFDLPRDHEPVDVRLESAIWEDVELPAPVIPFAGDVPGAYGDPDPGPADPAIYESGGLYPREAVVLGGTGLGSRGTLVGVHVSAVRYDPQGQRLTWLREGRVVLNSRPRSEDLPEGAVRRLRSSTLSEDGAPAVTYAEKGFAPQAMPSLNGSPVEMVVVTTDEQASAWQRLVDWKTKTGMPTVLRTIDEILDTYREGVDSAERLRDFIKDAYSYWGTDYILLAGPSGEIPIRFGHSWAWNQPAGIDIVADYYFACLDGTLNADGDGVFMEPIHATNELGDGRDGPDRRMDLIPDVEVGRIPARSLAEADEYLDKYFQYVQEPPDDGYLNRIMLIGEVLFQAGWIYGDCDTCSTCPNEVCVTMDGAEDAEQVAQIVSKTEFEDQIEFVRLYERDYMYPDVPGVLPTTRDNFVTNMNNGMNVVQHVGHGDVDRWAVGSDPNSRIQLQIVGTDLEALTNGPRFSGLTYAINCNSAAINFDCLALASLLNPDGGTMNYIGATNLDFPVAARIFQNTFYEKIFVEHADHMGEAYYRTMEDRALATPILVDSRDNSRRFVMYSLIFMGDPTAQLWLGNPEDLVVSFPGQVDLGEDEVTVEVRRAGSLLEGARVMVRKDDESYAVGMTDASGSVTLPLYASTTGTFEVTASAYQSLTSTSEGTVNDPGVAALSVENVRLLDDGADGNDNDVAEMGETITVELTVANTGSQAADSVQAVLQWAEATWEGEVELLETTADLGSISAGGSSPATQAFQIHISRTVPDSLEKELIGGDQMDLKFTVELSHAGGSTRSFAWTLSATRPVFSRYANILDDTTGDGRSGDADGRAENSEVVDLSVGLWNRGRGTGSFLEGTMTASVNGGSVVPLDVPIADMATSSTASVGPFRTTVISTADLRLYFSLKDTRDDVVVYRDTLRLFYPDAVVDTSLVGIGQRNNIILTWDNPVEVGSGIMGARLFRAQDPDGPFTQILDGLVMASVRGPEYYSDEGLTPLTRYYYQISLVDSSGNEGELSPILGTTTSPGALEGWPLLVRSVTRSSPTVSELTGFSSETREVLFGSNIVYCLQGNGDEYVDGDQVPSTQGILTLPINDDLARGHIWSKIATLNLEGDGSGPEIIVSHRDGSPDDAEFGVLAVYDNQGHTKWTRSLGRFFLGSPAVGDVDDDQEFEVVAANGNKIFVFNHDGTSATSTGTGRLVEIATARNMYQTPTVVDLDKDGKDEIIVASWNGNNRQQSPELWAVNGDGSNVPGFPVILSEVGEGSNLLGNTGQVVVADLDQDEEYELAFLTGKRFWIFEHDGTLKFASPVGIIVAFANGGAGLQTPAIGDLNGDGVLEVVFAMKTTTRGVLLHALLGTAPEFDEEYELEGFPVKLYEDGNLDVGSPILANLNEDEFPEIAIGDAAGRVHVYDRTGQLVSGFPYQVAGGDLRYGGLAAWDVDGDGSNNLVIQAWQSQEITVLDLADAGFPSDSAEVAAQNPWPMKYHDVRNSGNVTIPFLTPVLLSQLRAVEVEPGMVRIQFATSLPASEFDIWRLDPGQSEWSLRHRLDGDLGGFAFYEVYDEVERPGIYEYRIDLVDAMGRPQEASRFKLDVSGVTSRVLTLWPNRPNPFNPRTLLSFSIPGLRSAPVELTVHDLSGRVVRRLVQESLAPGFYEFEWDGRNDDGHPVSSGLYLARLKARDEERNQKLMLLK